MFFYKHILHWSYNIFSRDLRVKIQIYLTEAEFISVKEKREARVIFPKE